MKEGILTVVSPIEGTPAYKAGILAGDIIVKIDGASTKGMALWEAVSKMRGPRHEEVVVTIIREGEPAPLVFSLQRDLIPMTSVRSAMLKPGYGYLRVTNFRMNTHEEIAAHLEKLQSDENPLTGLVIDLRDNPGGLLEQSVRVSDIFLEEGEIVSIKGRDTDGDDYSAHPDETKRDYPIVLLINGGSASAAEIVAGALQDNDRALVLGTTSFGKGSVQTVKPLRDGYALKYTIARYYTPSGRSIQAEGIHPDLVVKRRLLDKDANEGFDAKLIKEQDLQNHLMPEQESPEGEKEKEEKKKEEETEPQGSETSDDKGPTGESEEGMDEDAEIRKLMRLRDAVYKHSDRDPAALLLDSQINRAYELLKGYEIFNRVSKN